MVHFRLVKHAFNSPQERILKRRAAILDFAAPATPLQQAIPGDKWDEYCRAEEERISEERAKTAESASNERHRLELEFKLKEQHEIQAALLAKQGIFRFLIPVAAEMDLMREIDSFPGGRIKPTYVDIFHVTQPELILKCQPKKEQLILSHREEAKKKSNEAAEISRPQTTKQRRTKNYQGILTTPPDYGLMPKFEWETKIKNEEPPKPPPVVIELEPILPEAPLSRTELTTLIAQHTGEFFEKWKGQIIQEMEWNAQQWNERLDLISRLRNEKEEMKKQREAEEAKEKEEVKDKPVENRLVSPLEKDKAAKKKK